MDLQVKLPETLKSFVDSVLLDGTYDSASEYLVDLVQRDQLRREKKRLEGLALEGLRSGPPIEVTDDFWCELRKRIPETGSP